MSSVVKRFNILSRWRFISIGCGEREKKQKKMLNILCEGSLEDLFHVYPAVTANFLPVISLLLLIYSRLISGGLSRDDNLGLTAGI